MKVFCLGLSIVLFGCTSTSSPKQASEEELMLQTKRIDSLEKIIGELLQKSSTDAETIIPTEADSVLSEKKIKTNPSAPTIKVEVKPESPKMEQRQIKPSEPEKHYYKNSGKVSVEITRSNDRTEKFFFFDPSGNLTYAFEEHYSSYSVGVDILEWHDNGAVSKVKVHTNPGASMYWFESIYTFGINNEPEWRIDSRFPQESVTMPGENNFYWDKKNRSWKKQEVIYEQNVPRQ